MRSAVLALLAPVILCLTACERRPDPARVMVVAAARTTDVFREAGRRFEARGGVEVVFSFDSSSNLARQVMAGAPADVLICADRRWMDDVTAAGAIRAETRQDLLANELVMIAPAGAALEVHPTRDFDFAARLPQVRRIAVGDPAHVPAGRYARQTLESLGWWDGLRTRLVPTLDARAALRLVEIGEADAGIVYATDPRNSDKVDVVARFPADLHEPIRYPIALCSESEAAADFIAFLRTAQMTEVFEQAGFRVLPAAGER